jgi:hypothetical protein
MAINLSIYSNGNASSKTIAVDFLSDWLASSSNGVSDQVKYFFKFTTGAKDEDGLSYEVRIAESLSDLVLNKEFQRTNVITPDSNAYSNIKTMIMDYAYDFVYGHDVNQNGATIQAKAAMKFD